MKEETASTSPRGPGTGIIMIIVAALLLISVIAYVVTDSISSPTSDAPQPAIAETAARDAAAPEA